MDRRGAIRAAGAVSTLMGAVLPGVCGVYARSVYPVDLPGRRKGVGGILLSIFRLAAAEPFGAVLAGVSLVLLAAGLLLLAAGKKER